MSRNKQTDHNPLVAVEDLYIQAILDTSPEELRSELIAMGEDPDTLIAGVDEVFSKAFACCKQETDAQAGGDVSAGARQAAVSDVDVSSGSSVAALEVMTNPFAAHDKVGLKAVATRFGCNLNFLGRLKDRLVRTEDMSAGFLASLADALGTRVEALAKFLAGPPLVPHAVRFKADGKPEAVEKQSLADALENAGLAEDRKQHLRSL